MHVAFVSTYPPQRCGVASYTRDVIAALSARDPSLVVGVCAEHGASSSDARPVWPCFDGDGDYVGPILDRLDELDATVVHVQHEYGIFGVDDRFHELLAGLRQRQRSIVVTMHTVHTALSFDLGCSWRQRRPPLDDLLIEQYQRRLGDGADAIIVHQERPIREVLLRQGVAPGHVRTIPHGTTMAPPAVRAAAESRPARPASLRSATSSRARTTPSSSRRSRSCGPSCPMSAWCSVPTSGTRSPRRPSTAPAAIDSSLISAWKRT